ncbi:prephenate dehydrogenase [Calidifontibacillus erzurumensis]|uniref:Prephenate dehydrogenase n=1 Tax=Calidifontibacillus erzurumensis TaxID=2741433 RepID=A0A8J8GFP5_9BACI|nr:prephenate dehydrogenase [Calidifontibacillus erzurumensis]NSL52286.1 prephenate dehydrogenase [Calidifontibacillus erzurumensis]
MKKTVFVIGLGLIGGSIALAIKRKYDINIIGFDVNEERVGLAKTLQVIDESANSIEEGAVKANLIVISAPVQQTEKIIEQLATVDLDPSVIITDVGSTKKQIMKKAELLLEKGVTFIGGHPMAGSHKSGVSAARAHLFENAFYILTPSKQTSREKIDELKDWLEGTKANFLILSPDEHDELTGAISHFPHIVAASLVHQVAMIAEENSTVSRLAAGGFRDITRIASSSPIMWRDILLHNKEILLKLLQKWQEEMERVKDMIRRMDGEAIYHYFLEAKQFRDGLPIRQKGAIPAFYDLYVDVLDHPGSISEVTSILAKEEISITNIRIIEIREDIMGVLRLSFRNEDDRKKAQEVLAQHKYETFIEM